MNLSPWRFSWIGLRAKPLFLGPLHRIILVLAVTGSLGHAMARGELIHQAAESGDLPTVRACLADDPNQISRVDAKGRTVLACAALSGKKELVEYLLEHGAPEDISAAAMVGHTARVADLLKSDPKLIDTKDSSGKCPLHWAALYGQTNVVELLLARHADVNALDDTGFTPLHWAAMFNRSGVVTLLLANKANFNIKVAKFGWTPLRLAIIHGNVATAEVLLRAGADVNVDQDEVPLLHQAVYSNNRAMVELLLAHQMDVNLKDFQGDTPLFEALEAGQKDVADLLRKYGGRER